MKFLYVIKPLNNPAIIIGGNTEIELMINVKHYLLNIERENVLKAERSLIMLERYVDDTNQRKNLEKSLNDSMAEAANRISILEDKYDNFGDFNFACSVTLSLITTRIYT